MREPKCPRCRWTILNWREHTKKQCRKFRRAFAALKRRIKGNAAS